MAQAMDLGCSSRKRKGYARNPQSHNRDTRVHNTDEWESSSSAGVPNPKRVIFHCEGKSNGSEEVGDTDDIHSLGKEILNGITENEIKAQLGLHGGVYHHHHHHPKIPKIKNNNEGKGKKEEKKEEVDGGGGLEIKKEEALTINDTKLCMQSVMMELKKAQEGMIVWLRQEVKNILNSKGAAKSKIKENDKKVSIEKSPALEFVSQESANDEEEKDREKEKEKEEDFLEPNNVGIGYKNREDSSHNEMESLVKKKADLGIESKDNINGEERGFKYHHSNADNENDASFIRDNGGLNFGVQSNRGNGMNIENVISFDRAEDEFINSRNPNESEMGFVNANDMHFSVKESPPVMYIENGSSRNFGGRSKSSEKKKGDSAVHISDEDRTHDLIGMQSMVWSNSNQNSRAINHAISPHASLHDFNNYDVKVGNSGAYRGLMQSNSSFENGMEMLNSTSIPRVGTSSSSNAMNAPAPHLPSFMGLQNQVPMQGFSGMQNFLELSMNGNMGAIPQEGRQVFTGLYLNECRHHAAANAKLHQMPPPPPLPPASASQSRARKRSSSMQGVDILELN